MQMKSIRHHGMAAGLLLGFAIPILTAASEPQNERQVPYVTGGIGLTESTRLLAERSSYPLAVEVYEQDAGREVYTAGADVVLRDAHGNRVLEATATGPFLFAEVPPGRYRVEVTNNGRTRQRHVLVRDGLTARAVFVFDAA